MQWRTHFFVLDEHGDVIAVDDALVWGWWFEHSLPQRVVAKDRVGDVEVSTVFLGLDHNYRADGPPVLWESLIFGGPFDGRQDRYTSRSAALEGHRRFVELVQRGDDPREDR